MSLEENLFILLQEHLTRHPKMEWIDVYKLLYQGTCGGEHLLGDIPRSETAFYEEWQCTFPNPQEPLMERVSIDGSRVRLNFGRCRRDRA
ncbi:MAG: hypothetical protein ONB24_06840 [candidate division KSB1 bacterium]|nr:hypothetical protein [candidate division KSB1 bacterium]